MPVTITYGILDVKNAGKRPELTNLSRMSCITFSSQRAEYDRTTEQRFPGTLMRAFENVANALKTPVTRAEQRRRGMDSWDTRQSSHGIRWISDGPASGSYAEQSDAHESAREAKVQQRGV